MFNGLNNKLANVPTITGLSDITADSVITDTLIVDGNDVSSIIDQVPINTADIAALKIVTTGQSYATLGDLTTFDNNVTLTPGKNMTADNFIGLATNAINADNALQLRIENTNTGTLYYPTFVDNFSTGIRTVRARTNLSYNLSTNGLSCSELSALTTITPSNGSSVLLNGTPIGNGGNINTVCMGVNAGNTTMPNNNFCFGTNAGRNLSTAGGFQSGVQNLCIGANSGSSLTFGRNNTFLGPSAARFTTTGRYNTQIGGQSQAFPDNNLIGSYNTTIGAECHILNDGLSYSTAIGANVVASTSNTVQIGRSNDNTVFDGTVTFNNNLLLTSPATTLTPTELSYLDGATSNIQAQINAFPAAANIVTTNTVQTITAAKTFDADLIVSSIGNAWLNGSSTFISTSTSGTVAAMRLAATATQTFIQAGVPSTAGSAADIIFTSMYAAAFWATMNSTGLTMNNTNITLGASSNLILTTPSVTLTPTELSYLDGASSNIQAQINAFPAAANTVTLTGAQTITGVKSISTGLSASASCMDWLDTVTNNRLSFRLNAGLTAFNNLTQAGDSMLLCSNTGPNIAGNITIGPWCTSLSGVRITPLKTFIGVGTTVKTAAVECEGSNVTVTGTLIGNLSGLASQASNIAVAVDNTATTYYPTFTSAGAGQKALLFDTTTTPLSYVPSTSTLTATNHTGTNFNLTTTLTSSLGAFASNVVLTNPNIGGSFDYLITPASTIPYVIFSLSENNSYMRLPFIFEEEICASQFSLGGLSPVSGTNAGFIAQNIASTATVIQNQATSGFVHLNTRTALNALVTSLSISSTAATFNATAIFNGPNITVSGTTINFGQGAGGSSNLICGNTDAKNKVFTIGNNTVVGSSAGNSMLVGAFGNTFVGNSAGIGNTDGDENTFVGGGSGFQTVGGTGVGNVCLGNGTGQGMITTCVQNTFVGAFSGYQAGASGTGNNNTVCGYNSGRNMSGGGINNTFIGSIVAQQTTTASGNTICGHGAFSNNITGANNTCVGLNSGDNISGSNNICIGNNSAVPTPAGSNQIVIGTNNETMFMQGGFNWKFGGIITNSTNGNLSAVVMSQFYIVTMSAASQTITLPNPVSHTGKQVLFKRKTNTTAFTITSTGGAGFLNYGAISIAASPYAVAATIFQVDLISDGVNWCVVAQR